MTRLSGEPDLARQEAIIVRTCDNGEGDLLGGVGGTFWVV
jgi:hypothetical protein